MSDVLVVCIREVVMAAPGVTLPPCPNVVLTPEQATKQWDEAQAALFALPRPGESGFDAEKFDKALARYDRARVASDEAWRNDSLESFRRAGDAVVKRAGLQPMYDGLKAPTACTSLDKPIAANWPRLRSRMTS